MKLGLITLVALALRSAALVAAWKVPCLLDECFYSQLATRLAEGEGFQPHARHYWPPAYIAFLAAHLKAGLGLGAAKVTQVLLSTLLVPLAWAMGRQAARAAGRTDGERVGLVAAALIAVHPTLIAYAHYLWSETLFLALFTAGLLLVEWGRRRESGAALLTAGLLLGTACLIKVLPLYLLPLLAVWLLWPRPGRRPLTLALMLLLGATALILPWTVRNYAVHGRLVLVETTSGKNLVRGNNPVAPANWDWGTFRSTRGVIAASGCADADLVAQDACLRAYGLGQIRQHPMRFISGSATKVADLINPTSFLVRHIRRDLYGAWPPLLANTTVTLVALFHMAIMALAVWGWSRNGGSWRQLTMLIAGYMVAVHVLTFAMSRFRLPLAPLLVTGAALALVPSGVAGSAPRRSRWWAVALLLTLLAGWSVRLADLYAPPSPEASPGLSRPED